jgi:hypothetical protein
MNSLDRKAGIISQWLVLLALIAGSLTASELPKEWRNWSHSREIGERSVDEKGELLRVQVPEDLFEHASSDLADLRLIDQSGNEIGYVLFSPGRGSEPVWRQVDTSDSGVVAERYYQVVADIGGGGFLHNALEVTLAPGDDEVFVWAEVAASTDRETWRIVRQRAPLYRFDEKGFRGPVTVRYARTRDRWLRVRFSDDAEDVRVEKLRVAEDWEDETAPLAIRLGMSLRSDSPKGESRWEPLEEMLQIPVSGARVATAREEFHRPVVISVSDDGKSWRQIGRGHVYRYKAGEGDDPSEQQSLEVEVRETVAPYWRITVLDRGDPPIADLDVRLLRARQSVVFRPEGSSPLRMLYGNHRAERPEYELVRLASRGELAAAQEVTLEAEQANDAYVSPDPFSERHPIILWAALGLAVLVVGGLALRSLR